MGMRAAAGFAGIFLFIFALQVVKTGAKGLVPLLDSLSISGPANAIGFGWLLAYGALSGSPVAAIGITLQAGGALTEFESFGVVGGSRLGASFIVLAVGFILYLRHRRDADGLVIGVIALITTITIQGPAIILGLISLHYGWLDGVTFNTPTGLLDIVDRVYGPPVEAVDRLLPSLGVFAFGVGVLLASFTIFDRALPPVTEDSERLARMHRLFDRPMVMFLAGALVTTTTLSVSISLTALVPLALKGYVKRDQVIPYVMGANITTFFDTLVGAVLLGGAAAFTVVLTEMLAVAVISAVVLLFFYRPYKAGVLRTSGWATRKPSHLGVFLTAIVGVPLVLLFL